MLKTLLLSIICLFASFCFGQIITSQGEYFWDADPGEGNGTAILALDGSFDEALEDLFASGINTTGLSIGGHTFSVRVKGHTGAWSNVFKQTIYIDASVSVFTRVVEVSQGEYFWDIDPGEGSGTPILALDGTFDDALEDLFASGISVSGLSVGSHSFNVRIQGNTGAWSALFSQAIYIKSPLSVLTRTVLVSQGEYFWDFDPGAGNGIPILALDGSLDETLEDLFASGIDVSGLSVGPHNFQVRIKGNNGTWSKDFNQVIYIESPLVVLRRSVNVSQGEYFWDTDPGEGSGISILALDGSFNEAIEDLFHSGISTGSLSPGAHSFNIRVKGNNGTWSSSFKQIVYVNGTTAVKNNKHNKEWTIFPNPSNGVLNIINEGIVKSARAELYSLQGQLLDVFTLNGSSNEIHVNYASGKYFVKLIDLSNGEFKMTSIIIN